MSKKHIITISGKPGSGKSTTSKLLAKDLGYQHFSSGDLFRKIGKERGADILDANKLAENNKEIDFLVDSMLRELGSTQDKLVIDSRMAWHWMPYSYRVYLNLDLLVAAKRIIDNLDPERLKVEHIPQTPEEYAEELHLRLQSEAKRYMNLYQVNPYDLQNYDLVVDTTEFSIPEVEEMILSGFRNWLS